MTPAETVRAYHAATKHHFNRYARSMGYMDWDLQPNPFRAFKGAPRFLLPLAGADDSPAYNALYEADAIAPRPFNAAGIGWLLEHSMGLSAWKAIPGARWALRCNPSSGNLHPTESYLISGPVEGLSDHGGVYHYAPDLHALELRTRFDASLWRTLIPEETVVALIGFSSIHWRESWKYGERAYRYCQHDAGHAMAAVAMAAAALGWEARSVAISDGQLSALLGLDRRAEFPALAECEAPDALLAIRKPTASTLGGQPVTPAISGGAIRTIATGEWYGEANRLSAEHHDWPIVDAVSEAAWRERAAATDAVWPESVLPRPSGKAAQVSTSPCAGPLFRQRRSAVEMDGETGMHADSFYTTLLRVMPRNRAPWLALEPPCCVDLGLFVHRVEGLTPGLYWLARGAAAIEELREATKAEFEWTRPPGCPPELPLYFLRVGDVRDLAASVSCQQAIAADGAFAAAMIARYASSLDAFGPWWYRRLHWETGMIGQVLYLEAEAANLRATGIGCFFDDASADCFGLRGDEWQTLYHFTVGGPLEDERLTTLPGYDEARKAAPAGWTPPGWASG